MDHVTRAAFIETREADPIVWLRIIGLDEKKSFFFNHEVKSLYCLPRKSWLILYSNLVYVSIMLFGHVVRIYI